MGAIVVQPPKPCRDEAKCRAPPQPVPEHLRKSACAQLRLQPLADIGSCGKRIGRIGARHNRVKTLLGIAQGTRIYFEVTLIIAMLGFVSTVAYARFVLRGDIIE